MVNRLLLPMGFFNVAPKKEMFFFYHFPKEYVGRSIQNAVNTKLYINSKILRAVYLYSLPDIPTLILISTKFFSRISPNE